ncbi:TonB-dependent receptor plug domain-containing protein [Pseudoalteromonas denitrificans]|uniref:Outer membrane receptor proteins, mostly Fe transport n=1 Tax=Pseudoalteromonas denitrificans DSM 6059 TaxID=1123010 RepID=A0A1I1I6B5_9GAMM|nr:hypothetical protein [Pseudoalteromonas denitrificans]SFC31666.1 Outer membrane receptor proteins, mostly Fe transport [Pseudoalteromonas denitrificans DSM 6059]
MSKFVNTLTKTTLVYSAIAMSCILPKILFADEANNKAAITGYDTQYFKQFSPQTLFDMIEKIPGTASILDSVVDTDDNRGFGSAGEQLLINGKRISGKSNGIGAELYRIQAKNVDEIQLIRGTVNGLDVRSTGLIINVILKEDMSASILWDLGLAYASDVNAEPIGSLNYTDSTDIFTYSLGYKRTADPRYAVFSEVFNTNQDQLNETRVDKSARVTTVDKLNGKIEYFISDKTDLRLNGLLEINKYKGEYDKAFYYANAEQNSPINVTDLSHVNNQNDTWEIGGDINHKLDDFGNLKLLFITNKTTYDDKLLIDRSEDFNTTFKSYDLNDKTIQSENILRPTFSSQINEKHSIEVGFELAINKRDSTIITNVSPTEHHMIKETRKEAFISHNFAFSDTINLQSSLNNEWSNVIVDSQFEASITSVPVERSFKYPKPRFNLRYDMTEQDQWRFNFERTVSQLNLKDFVPKYNGEEKRLELTNPNLMPEKRWEFSSTYERQFNKNQGNLATTLYYHDIEDHLTETPYLDSHNKTIGSGIGNINNAKEYGIKLDGSLRLSLLNLKNTVFSGNLTYRGSKTHNSFTHEKQYINDLPQLDWSANLKHDQVNLGLAFGITFSNKSAERYNRYDFIARYENHVNAKAYIDYQLTHDLKLRFEGDKLFHGKGLRETTRYESAYTHSDILRYEVRDTVRERRFKISLKGQF